MAVPLIVGWVHKFMNTKYRRDQAVNSSPEIRLFESYDEIKNVHGFKENHPVSTETYDSIRGDYNFKKEEEVECCFQKSNGNLCKTKHQYGFVVNVKDGFVTIIGNCCAKDKFAAEAQIRIDRSRYINERKRQERLQSLGRILSDKENRLATMRSLSEDLESIWNRVNTIRQELGEITLRRLSGMAQTGNLSVVIKIVSLTKYIDKDDGQEKTEVRSRKHTLGTLRGTSIFDRTKYDHILGEIREVRNGYSQADLVTDKIKPRDLDLISSQLNKYDSIINEVALLKKSEAEFCDNDFTLLCFLSSNKVERYASARLVLRMKKVPSGKDKAKAWLSNVDTELKQSLGADRLEIEN